MCILWLIVLRAVLILLSPFAALIFGIGAAAKIAQKNSVGTEKHVAEISENLSAKRLQLMESETRSATRFSPCEYSREKLPAIVEAEAVFA